MMLLQKQLAVQKHPYASLFQEAYVQIRPDDGQKPFLQRGYPLHQHQSRPVQSQYPLLQSQKDIQHRQLHDHRLPYDKAFPRNRNRWLLHKQIAS